MDNLTQKLLNLPKPKLGKVTDLKIRSRLYLLVIFSKFRNLDFSKSGEIIENNLD